MIATSCYFEINETGRLLRGSNKRGCHHGGPVYSHVSHSSPLPILKLRQHAGASPSAHEFHCQPLQFPVRLREREKECREVGREKARVPFKLNGVHYLQSNKA